MAGPPLGLDARRPSAVGRRRGRRLGRSPATAVPVGPRPSAHEQLHGLRALERAADMQANESRFDHEARDRGIRREEPSFSGRAYLDEFDSRRRQLSIEYHRIAFAGC